MSTANEPTPNGVATANEPGLEPAPGPAEANTVQKLAQGLSTLPMATNPFGSGQASPELDSALGTELATRVEQVLAGEVAQELQQELAELVMLIPNTMGQLGPTQLQMLRSAVRALLGAKPNFTYARELKEVLKKAIREENSPLRLSHWQRASPAILVVMGLGLFAYFVAPMALWAIPKLMHWGGRTMAMGLLVEDLVLITIVGALGSVTSIMVRLQDFNSRYSEKPGALVLFGFFKPLIGMFFALFCYGLLNAGLVPAVVVPEGKAIYFYITIAFIAGFSERFAGDLISQVEKRALPDTSALQGDKP
ncbi:MAG TPA: hypothetical protein VF794_14735 [Archangium sp.]|uniref:hypothetical protein n=1 Tax=Archangium sp. TaxID=1872627 RepID=UPI002ED8B849